MKRLFLVMLVLINLAPSSYAGVLSGMLDMNAYGSLMQCMLGDDPVKARSCMFDNKVCFSNLVNDSFEYLSDKKDATEQAKYELMKTQAKIGVRICRGFSLLYKAQFMSEESKAAYNFCDLDNEEAQKIKEMINGVEANLNDEEISKALPEGIHQWLAIGNELAKIVDEKVCEKIEAGEISL